MARRQLDGRHRLDAFEHGGDQRRCDAVIGKPPLARHGDEPCIDELREMLAGGRWRNVRQKRELAAGQRAAAHQRVEHGRARRIAHQRRELDHICCRYHT
jgi:hypothetical protein